VALPKPFPGLVVRYSYLWSHEYAEGLDEGTKDRPCAIVAAILSKDTRETKVLVLPITHRVPSDRRNAIEIPPRVKERLRLDAARSWVVISEWNEFTWPGPDLRRTPGGDASTIAYGVLPPRLFAEIRKKLVELLQTHKVKRVPRTRGGKAS
jgi:hypothetical protein